MLATQCRHHRNKSLLSCVFPDHEVYACTWALLCDVRVWGVGVGRNSDRTEKTPVTHPLLDPYHFWYASSVDRRKTYRDRLREAASEHDGYLTPTLAEEYGVPKVELRKLASRGAFEKIHRGVYRDPYFPASEHDELRELLLLLGDGSYLSGETVLALLDLADVNPRKVTITSPRRHQRHLPHVLEVKKPQRAEQPHFYEGLPCQPLKHAIADAAPGIMPERAVHATKQARTEGLLLMHEYDELMEILQHA